MVKAILYKLLAYVVQSLIDANLFTYIQEIVSIAGTRTELSGEEKKELVLATLGEAQDEIFEVFSNTSKNLVNLAVEAAVTIFKGSN